MVTWVVGGTAFALFAGASRAVAAASPSPSPSPTPPAAPILNLTGADAAWFVGGVFGVMIAAAAAVVWWNGSLNKSSQDLIDKIVNQPANGVSERVQLLGAVDGQVSVRGASKGTTRAAIALMIITLAALALAATLISGAPDAPSLRNTIVSALLATLATIAGFYFGAKTAQDNNSSTSTTPSATNSGAANVAPGAPNNTTPSDPSNVSPASVKLPASDPSNGNGPTAPALPQVTDVAPNPAGANTPVTITGTGLKQTAEIRFGRVVADIIAGTATDTSIQATVPEPQLGVTQVDVTVTTSDGASAEQQGSKFTYQ
jgi:hypothetical protein